MSFAGLHSATAHRSTWLGVEALSIKSDRAYPRHSHDQFGVGVIDFGGHRSWSGRGAVEAAAGDVIMVNPGEIHDGAPIAGAPRGWRMLYFSPDLLAAEMADQEAPSVEAVRPVAADPGLAALVSRLFESAIDPVAEMIAIEEASQCLFGRILARHAEVAARRSPPPEVKRALERIDAAPEVPTSLAELAALSGVSRFQLLRGFRRAVGMTPHAYLLQERVKLAKRLLAAGRSPADCAVEAGFADQSHLTRAFLRQLGMTPGRYRAALDEPQFRSRRSSFARRD